MDILPTDEFIEVDNRYYANPQTSLNESTRFIDNLRATQAQQNQQIAQGTYNLGTDISSNLGGLGTNTPAGMSYFTSRYQTPQTNSVVANLRATAQAAALNQVLENEQAKWKKRYQDAYRNYQKSAYNRSYGGGGNNTQILDTTAGQGDVSVESTDLIGKGTLSLDSEDFERGGKYIVEPGTGNIIRVDDTLDVNDPNYQQVYVQQADGSYQLKSTPQRRNLTTEGTLKISAPLSSALRSNL